MMPPNRPIEDLYPKVLMYAPGCPEPLAVDHLRDAAITLCERTRCWRDVDEFETDGESRVVIPAIVPGTALYEIEKAWFEEQELEPTGYAEDMLFHDNGYPRRFSQQLPDTLQLIPAGSPGTVRLSMWLKPSQDAEELPKFFFEQFAQALADGALSTLLLIPNQPFTNPQMAAVFDSRFTAMLDRNFAYNMRGQQRARKRTKASFF